MNFLRENRAKIVIYSEAGSSIYLLWRSAWHGYQWGVRSSINPVSRGSEWAFCGWASMWYKLVKLERNLNFLCLTCPSASLLTSLPSLYHMIAQLQLAHWGSSIVAAFLYQKADSWKRLSHLQPGDGWNTETCWQLPILRQKFRYSSVGKKRVGRREGEINCQK